jgi:drug/metabolite transporter (DMT)-like permease
VTLAPAAALPSPATHRAILIAVLIACGLAWGSTQTLGKLSVSTGYRHFGLLFWQFAIGAALLGAVLTLRRNWPPLTRRTLGFALLIAIIGTLIPGSTFYLAVAQLPAGIMSILISTVPLLAFPIALALRQDRFSVPRLAGLLCGLAGVALIAGPGATALPAGTDPIWLAIAMIGPLFYAIEGNVVARLGTFGMDGLQLMTLASLIGAVMALPLALGTGQFISPLVPFGTAEWALVAGACVHAMAYATYVWLASNAGAVFAAQTSYIVTGTGVFWAMGLLGERLSPYAWAALLLMLAGLALVQPRARSAPSTPEEPV